jgi:hypothetical protein
MGHYVTSETSDYFVGYCDVPGCTERPCLSCVRAQERYERAEQLRCKLLSIYQHHHSAWPQRAFIDDIIAAFEKHHGSDCAKDAKTP